MTPTSKNQVGPGPNFADSLLICGHCDKPVDPANIDECVRCGEPICLTCAPISAIVPA